MMKVSKWGNSLAVRLPTELVEKLGIKEGDELVEAPGFAEEKKVLLTRQKTFEEKMARLREIRRKSKLPPGYKFDRDEIYDEHMNTRWKKDE
ncbi:MAG: AbrB/MazE/SpoVT family DNA-binding domain-containing protein [Aestuariivirga sp.]